MTTSIQRARRAFGQLLTVLFLAACLALPAAGATAATASAHHAHSTRHAHSSKPIASAARTLPRVLGSAAKHSKQADHTLVTKARALKRCLRTNGGHTKRCNSSRHAVQLAGVRLARSERRLSRIARSTAKSKAATKAASSAALHAPKLTISGYKLSWTRVAHIKTYLLVREVPGQADQYSVIHGTSTTPPPVPGLTVGYSVRTTANGSAWATEQAIAYAPVTGTVDTQAVPVLGVSGQTLTWHAIAGVGTYVLATKVPGQADRYSVLSGTSITPAPIPGATVHYSIRTAVDGSAWSPEVAIAYPATAPSPAPAEPTSGGSTGSFEMGIVPESLANSEPSVIQQLGAHSVRMEFPIGAPASELAPYVEAYAKVGVRLLPLAGFAETIPTSAQARNLASWASEFGPGGSFWQGKSFPADTAITNIEFGNETSYTYQFSDNSTGAVAGRAQTYAIRLKEANEAIHSADSTVGLLAQADDGDTGSSTWVDNMFKAVPQLAQLVAGWTVHPYGPTWQTRIDHVVSQTQADGAPASIPIYVTEWGLATDNGHCLSDNYGWNKCMTYQEAATTLSSTVTAMRARYGSRLHAFYLYQAQDQSASGASTDREQYFGALQNDGASKGQYTAEVESLLTTNP